MYGQEQYQLKRKEEKEKYEKLSRELQATRRSSQEALRRIERTLVGVQESQQMLDDTRNKLDSFQSGFRNAMSKMAQKLAASFLAPPFKKSQSTAPEKLLPKTTPADIALALSKAKGVLFVTGAGLSAGSGIRTFRDKGGYWDTKDESEKDPKQILTKSFYDSNKAECWEWHKRFYQVVSKSRPNQGHRYLQRLIKILNTAKVKSVHLTQNIDNLHIVQLLEEESVKPLEYGVYEQVFQIHGNIRYARCETCKQLVDSPVVTGVHLCKKCSSELRPHTMFFDQSYNQQWHRTDTAKNQLADFDTVVFVGTSLQTGFVVNLAAHFTNEQQSVFEISLEQAIEVGKGGFFEQNADIALPAIHGHLVGLLN